MCVSFVLCQVLWNLAKVFVILFVFVRLQLVVFKILLVNENFHFWVNNFALVATCSARLLFVEIS